MCAHAKRDRKNFNSYVSKDQTLAIASHQLTLMLAACFFRRFLDSVQAAGGLFLHIPTGNARSQQAALAGSGGHWDGPEVLSAPGTSALAEVIPTAECPVLAYRQGAADLCATYGLASAVHEYGDASAAGAHSSMCGRAALAQRYVCCVLHEARPIFGINKGE